MAKRRAEWTDESVRSLPFEKNPYQKSDADCRGLVVRVARDSRSYGLQLRTSPTSVGRWKIGNCDTVTLAEARAKTNEWRALVAKGLDPHEEESRRLREAQAKIENSFEAVARSFIVRHAAPKNRTWKTQARQLGFAFDNSNPDDPKKMQVAKGGIVDRWRGRDIGEIRRYEINDILDKIVDRGNGVLANRVLAVLHKLFNWAIGRDHLDANPCAGIEAPAEEKSRDRLLSEGELVAVWKAADALGYPWGPWAKILILTGQRRGEVAGMKWGELDLDKKLWRLPGERVKNDIGHEVPLSDAAMKVLSKIDASYRVKDCPFVFTTTGKTAVSGFSKAKKLLDKKSGKGAWRWHDLRRTLSTGMADGGIEPHVIEALLNHISGHKRGVAGVYNRSTYEAAKRIAVDHWGRTVTALVEGKQITNVKTFTRQRARA